MELLLGKNNDKTCKEIAMLSCTEDGCLRKLIKFLVKEPKLWQVSVG